ncbi:MAG: efflux RND transporter periplasmic adaptor subunit, partial [Candidatus Margulisiibacteriota bacterium]
MKNRLVIGIFLAIVAVILYYSFGFLAEYVNRGRITASGTIDVVEVRVGTKASGKIIELNVDEGSRVKVGDVIARIDIPEIEAALNSALSAERAAMLKSQNAAQDFKRIYNLYEKGMASKQQYDSSKTFADSLYEAYLQAKDWVDSVKVEISDAVIKAPISGAVLTKAAEKGELVSAGSTIVSLGNLAKLELKVYISEKEYGKISIGDSVAIFVDSYPRERFAGLVKYISSQAEFTPKSIQTKDERVNQMFEIK